MRANPLTLVGFVMVFFVSILAVLIVAIPPVTQLLLGKPLSIVPFGANTITPDPHVPPSWAHPFGTDDIGRDMYSRVLLALPLDLVIGLLITAFSLGVGGGLGLIAGFWDTPGTIGGAVSAAIMRVTDVFLAFPSLVLALAIAASLGRSTSSAILALMLAWWPYYVRLARGEVLAVKHLPYVTAAKAAGVSDWRILTRHVFRNIIEPLTVYYTMDVGNVIVTFSTISFIGIGVPQNTPEWGSMVEAYEKFLLSYPWTIAAPGLAIFVTVLAFSLLGDGLRDILDPRSRRALTQTAASSGTAAASAEG
jgi:peptide/nickel transport system permease protein